MPANDQTARQVVRSVLAARVGAEVIDALADDFPFTQAGIGSLDIAAVLYQLEEDYGWPIDGNIDIGRELVNIEAIASLRTRVS
jgi:acyl carrier protein